MWHQPDLVLQGFAYDFTVFVFEKVCVVVFVVTGDTLPPDAKSFGNWLLR